MHPTQMCGRKNKFQQRKAATRRDQACQGLGEAGTETGGLFGAAGTMVKDGGKGKREQAGC